jgi:hypothetical protein
MFDKFTTNATSAAQTLSTRLTTAADEFAAFVTTTVDDASKKVRNVEFDLTKFDVSKIDLPKIDLTKFDVSKIDLPKIDLPKIDVSKIDLPKIDVGPEFAKVADLARDVAYAGLGAAVIAVHQVDAGVRRVTARAA